MTAEVMAELEATRRGLGALTAVDVEARLLAIEAVHRELAALEAEAIAEADSRKIWKRDGHHSIRGLLRLVCDETPFEITAKVQLARLVAAHPSVADDLVAGRYSVASARRLAKAMAHERAGKHFGEFFELLRAQAVGLGYEDLCRCVERWQVLVDPDGADDETGEIRARRRASLGMVGHQFVLRAEGDAVAGEALVNIFQAFLRVEFDKDWARTVEAHGESAAVALMPRTDAQRRFDALESIFHTAVATPPGSQAPEPVVNVIVDPATFAQAVARVFGVELADVEATPGEVMARRCETSTGTPIAPEQLARLLLAGHIRRVVCDSAGVVIDMGRKQRFFTGAAHTAASLLHTRCVWAGCRVPVARCQIDHLDEWHRDLGPTDQHNAGPLCDSHNWFKTNNRYRIERDRHGRYHTYRPDGTEVT